MIVSQRIMDHGYDIAKGEAVFVSTDKFRSLLCKFDELFGHTPGSIKCMSIFFAQELDCYDKFQTMVQRITRITLILDGSSVDYAFMEDSIKRAWNNL